METPQIYIIYLHKSSKYSPSTFQPSRFLLYDWNCNWLNCNSKTLGSFEIALFDYLVILKKKVNAECKCIFKMFLNMFLKLPRVPIHRNISNEKTRGDGIIICSYQSVLHEGPVRTLITPKISRRNEPNFFSDAFSKSYYWCGDRLAWCQ